MIGTNDKKDSGKSVLVARLDDIYIFPILFRESGTNLQQFRQSGSSGYLVGIRYPDEPLRRNCSRLVPDSRNNFCHYFSLLSIEHFFALVALQQLRWVFFLLTNQLRICWFFSIGVTRKAFAFFSNIYIYIYISPKQWFIVYFYLRITCGFFSLP